MCVRGSVGCAAIGAADGAVVSAVSALGGGSVGTVEAINSIFAKYIALAAATSEFTLTVSPAVGGAVVIIGGGSVLVLIYEIAKNQGKERGDKYQQIIDLQRALDADYLGSIQAKHKVLKTV